MPVVRDRTVRSQLFLAKHDVTLLSLTPFFLFRHVMHPLERPGTPTMSDRWSNWQHEEASGLLLRRSAKYPLYGLTAHTSVVCNGRTGLSNQGRGDWCASHL
jgi:hypothetical protein